MRAFGRVLAGVLVLASVVAFVGLGIGPRTGRYRTLTVLSSTGIVVQSKRKKRTTPEVRGYRGLPARASGQLSSVERPGPYPPPGPDPRPDPRPPEPPTPKPDPSPAPPGPGPVI